MQIYLFKAAICRCGTLSWPRRCAPGRRMSVKRCVSCAGYRGLHMAATLPRPLLRELFSSLRKWRIAVSACCKGCKVRRSDSYVCARVYSLKNVCSINLLQEVQGVVAQQVCMCVCACVGACVHSSEYVCIFICVRAYVCCIVGTYFTSVRACVRP